MHHDVRNDPVLGLALAYWERTKGDRTMPRKQDIDPVDIPARILPHLQVIEVLGQGEAFKYRLVGTEVSKTFGQEYSGKRPEEFLPPDRAQFITAVYRECWERREPLFARNKYIDARGSDLLIASRLYMPLSDDGRSVNYIFAALTFGYAGSCLHSPWGEAQLDTTLQYVRPVAQCASAQAR